jgi:uncharacterized protein (DUF2384 family)
MFSYLKHCNSIRLSKCNTPIELVLAILKRPLQKRNLETIAIKLRFSDKQTAGAAGLSMPKYKKLSPTDLLSIPATDNVIKLCELYSVGISIFNGGAKSLVAWLNANSPVLNGHQPIELLDGYMGSSYIKDLLVQVEQPSK